MLNLSNEIECKWIQFVEKTLNDGTNSNIWMTQCNNFNFNWFKACVNRRLNDRAVQEWHSHVFESNKCLNNRIFEKKTIWFREIFQQYTK